MTEIKATKIRATEIKTTEIRATKIKATEIRATKSRILSNHRELHGAIFLRETLVCIQKLEHFYRSRHDELKEREGREECEGGVLLLHAPLEEARRHVQPYFADVEVDVFEPVLRRTTKGADVNSTASCVCILLSGSSAQSKGIV